MNSFWNITINNYSMWQQKKLLQEELLCIV